MGENNGKSFTDKGLVSGMYKKLLQLKIEKQPSLKKAKHLNKHVSEKIHK